MVLATMVLVETNFYKHQGFYWIVEGTRLIQYSHDYFLEFMPGNEVYAKFMRDLRKTIPCAESEAKQVLNDLYQYIERLKA